MESILPYIGCCFEEQIRKLWKHILVCIRTNILYHTAPLASSLMDLGSDFKVAVSQCRKVVPLAQCDAELLRVVCTEK